MGESLPMIDELHGCCGIGVMYDLNDWTSIRLLEELYEECDTHRKEWDYKTREYKYKDWAPRFGLLIWSDTTQATDGKALAAYIRKHRLGLVHKSYQARNPNHNNDTTIEHWTWKPDWKNFFAHMKKRLDRS